MVRAATCYELLNCNACHVRRGVIVLDWFRLGRAQNDGWNKPLDVAVRSWQRGGTVRDLQCCQHAPCMPTQGRAASLSGSELRAGAQRRRSDWTRSRHTQPLSRAQMLFQGVAVCLVECRVKALL